MRRKHSRCENATETVRRHFALPVVPNRHFATKLLLSLGSAVRCGPVICQMQEYPRCYLSRMCKEGLLVKIGYGRYRAAVVDAASP